MVRYMQVLQPIGRNRRDRDLLSTVVSVAAWQPSAWRHDGKLPHLSPRKLSTSAAWQRGRTEGQPAPLIITIIPRRRGSAWTATATITLHTNSQLYSKR